MRQFGDGYIKLYRKCLNTSIWEDADLWRTFCCCLLLANHKPAKVVWTNYKNPIQIEPGQFVTGRDSFHGVMYPNVKKTALPTSKTVWSWLKILENHEILSIKSSNKFSIITITNWHTYQQGESENFQQNFQQASSRLPTDFQQTSTNKNDKNEKNDKNNTISSNEDVEREKGRFKYPDNFESFWNKYPRPLRKADTFKAWKNAKRNKTLPPLTDLLSKIEVLKKSEGWTKENGKYIPGSVKFISGAAWDDPVDLLPNCGPSPEDIEKARRRAEINRQMNMDAEERSRVAK